MSTITHKSISLTGTPHYDTLQQWADASPTNLTTSIPGGEIWQGEIALPGDVFTGSTTLLKLEGITTDATGYRHLTTASGASFIDHADVATNPLRYDSSKGAAVTSSHQETVLINETHSRVSKLQIQTTNDTYAGYALRINADAEAHQCITSSVGATGTMPFRSVGGIASSIFGEQRESGATYIARIESGSEIYNSTFIVPNDITAATTGVRGSYASSTLKNVAIFGCTTFDSSTAPTCTTCASDGASLPTGVTSTTYDITTGSGFVNITDATRDYQLGGSSALTDAGTYDSTNAPTDIVGTTLGSGTTPIGCWKIPAVGGSTIPVLMHHYRQQRK